MKWSGRRWQKARWQKLDSNSATHHVNEIQKVTGDFFEIETMLPFCRHTKSGTYLNKLHTSNTCVCRKVFLFYKLDRSSIFFCQTSDNKKSKFKTFNWLIHLKSFQMNFKMPRSHQYCFTGNYTKANTEQSASYEAQIISETMLRYRMAEVKSSECQYDHVNFNDKVEAMHQ